MLAATSFGRRLRLYRRSWPIFWSLLGILGFLLTTLLGGPEMWQGFFLAIPLMIVTIGAGPWIGLGLLPVAIAGLLWTHQVAGELEPWWYYPATTGLLLVWLASGASIYQRWRATERRAKRHAKRARLLAEAVRILQQCGSEQEVYEALPVLLADIVSFSHAEVLCPVAGEDVLRVAASHRWTAPEGFTLPLASVSGRALRSGAWQYVADTARDTEFVPTPQAAASRSELALPLLRGGQVVAVLNIESALPDSFSPGDQHILRTFAQMAEESLLRVSSLASLQRQIAERSAVASLNHHLLRARSTQEAARMGLEALHALLELEAALVLTLKEGRFRPLAVLDNGDLLRRNETVAELLDQGLPWQSGPLQTSWRERRSIFVDDYQASPQTSQSYRELGLKSAAFMPIASASGEVQALLLAVTYQQPRSWGEQERRVLTEVADTLGLALERAVTDDRLREMLEVIRLLAQADDPSHLYQSTVEAAVRLIADCEAASILVRTEGEFRYCGIYGYGPELLEAASFSEEELLKWYGQGSEGYHSGLPRVLSGAGVVTQSLDASGRADKRDLLLGEGKLEQIRSNICVPITHGRDIIGVLNLDSRTRDDAFGPAALSMAAAFAQQIAVIIRQAQFREALERNALTDALTGLGNRAAFSRRLDDELASATRFGHPLSLIIMDIDGFKKINDRFGHPAGDQALASLAQALREARRKGDSLYRWGGDEFALILPGTTRAGAALAGERYLKAVRRVNIQGVALEASMGVASHPEDGATSEALVKSADDLMYQDKAVR